VNVVDSSGWLEYFAAAPNAAFFTPVIEDIDKLVVPTLSLFEVFKSLLRQRGEVAALQALAQMRLGHVRDLDQAIAIEAALLSHKLHIAMADSVMLATARLTKATLWTQDADFKGLEGVKYFEKLG
jgi:toxin FitB